MPPTGKIEEVVDPAMTLDISYLMGSAMRIYESVALTYARFPPKVFLSMTLRDMMTFNIQ
jgi:hypothetical protein